MPWQALIWLLAFIMQAGILGVAMYQLVQLTDLEADYLNPHEASSNYNKLVLPEYAAQAVLTLLHIFSGHWLAALLQLGALAYNVQQYRTGKHLVDVTEIFREVGSRRRALTAKMVFYLLGFVWTIYRFIEIIVMSMITPRGRKAAKAILKEAAAALHRRR